MSPRVARFALARPPAGDHLVQGDDADIGDLAEDLLQLGFGDLQLGGHLGVGRRPPQ